MKKALYIFAVLNDNDMDWLATHGSHESISTGDVIIKKGVDIDAMYVVLEGELSVQFSSTGDQANIILGVGEIVGEMSFVDERAPSATVTARTAGSLLCVSKDLLLEKMAADPAFAARFYKAVAIFLSTRLRGTVAHLGYGGDNAQAVIPEEDEIDLRLLDDASIAGGRFDWLFKALPSPR